MFVIHRVLTRIVLTGLIAAGAVVTAQQRPEFEVASIRVVSDQVPQTGVGVHIDGSNVRFGGLSLKELIGSAYGLKPQQLVGPDWLGQARFEIAAKIPDGVPATQVPLMLRALLADRFQMKAHMESREFSVYAIVVGKSGFKLQAAPPPSAADADKEPAVNISAGGSAGRAGADLGHGASFALTNNRLEVRKLTLQSLAELLTRLSDRPVLDASGVTGAYDADIEIAPEDFTAVMIRAAVNSGSVLPPPALRLLEGAASDPFSSGLQKIGLALDSRKAPLDVLVIDAVQKTPTEN